MTLAAYEAIRPQLDTGDLVFMAGRGLVSSLIKLITRSRYSHVGMVYRPCPGLVLLWESTTLSPISPPGVKLVSLSDRIDAYEGTVAIRRLVDFERTEAVLSRLAALRRDLTDRPYEESRLELLRSVWPSFLGAGVDQGEEALRSVFCSELVAAAYVNMGLLEPGILARHYLPEDFSWRYVTLENGAQLEDEVIVKGDG